MVRRLLAVNYPGKAPPAVPTERDPSLSLASTEHPETSSPDESEEMYELPGIEALSGTHLPPERRLQLAWQVFTGVEYQVQVADRKVQAIFGANTLLVAALSLHGQSSLAEVMAGGITPLEMVALAARLFLLVSVCTSAGFAIMALMPRVRFRQPSPTGFPSLGAGTEPGPSVFFFGDIASLSQNRFVGTFSNLTTEEATEQILRQVHSVSAVVAAKYRWSRRAANFLVVSLTMWIVVLLLRFILA